MKGRDVVVIGVGMTRFGFFPERGIREMAAEASWQALQDAGVKPREIETAYLGYCLGLFNGQECVPGQIVFPPVGIRGIPVTRIESACASGSVAFREAYLGVASGQYDMAVALGLEMMSRAPNTVVRKYMSGGADNELESEMGLTFPGVFGMYARRHMKDFGTTLEHLALVTVKNRGNASLNPRAHFTSPSTVEEVLSSRMVADPLRLLNCCPISDGAAAAVLTTAKKARELGKKGLIRVAASVQNSCVFDEPPDLNTFEGTVRAAEKAYETSGLGPEDIDLAEVHDCFSIAEIMHVEDLGFCKKGEGGFFTAGGHTAITGKIPVSPSGGLLGKGHPLAATGVAQIVEVVEQLRGLSGPRQVPKARVGLTHTVGGFTRGESGTVVVTILKK